VAAILALWRRADFVPAKSLLLAVMVAAVALVAGLAQTSVGHSLLQGAGLYDQPASYTSLAFANPQSLPTQFSRSATSVHVSFTISNASTNSRTYQWSIVFDRAGRTYRLAAGTARVPAEGHVTVSRTVRASCSSGQARMTIGLAAPAESIHFLAACSP
jgi:hypothetical protein